MSHEGTYFVSETIVDATKEKLGGKEKERKVIGGNGSCEFRERQAGHHGILRHQNDVLRPQKGILLRA